MFCINFDFNRKGITVWRVLTVSCIQSKQLFFAARKLINFYSRKLLLLLTIIFVLFIFNLPYLQIKSCSMFFHIYQTFLSNLSNLLNLFCLWFYVYMFHFYICLYFFVISIIVHLQRWRPQACYPVWSCCSCWLNAKAKAKESQKIQKWSHSTAKQVSKIIIIIIIIIIIRIIIFRIIIWYLCSVFLSVQLATIH